MTLYETIISHLGQFADLFLHVDKHLADLLNMFGIATYFILFAIIFCETGLVVTPLLPGDSLLFATGALCAIEGSPLNVWLIIVLLYIAALMGDLTNFTIGKRLGPKVFKQSNVRFFSYKHLEQTQRFYEKHGGKTIVIARFMPIVRTFAPFVAGVGSMSFGKFLSYSIFGAGLWIPSFTLAGYYLGNIPEVKSRFHIIIALILVISVTPPAIQFLRTYLAERRERKAARA